MAMTDATRHSNALPSLSYIDLDKIKKENSFYNTRIPLSTAANVPTPALVSPSSMYSGPPPPYSYPSSTASSVVNGYTNGYISPPSEPLKPLETEKDQQQVGRQSLPSIHEALNRDQPLSITSLLTETGAPPPHPAQRASNNSPTSPNYRSYRDFPSSGPAVTAPSHTQPSPSHHEPSSRQHHSPPRLVFDSNSSRGPSSATRENHYPTMLPPRTVPSPATATRPPMPSSAPRHSSPAYESISRPAPILNPHTYGSHPAPYSYPPVMPTIASSFQPPSPSNPVSWRHNDRGHDRPDDDYGRHGVFKEHVMKPTFGEAVKRHLDNFDLETSLNEIAEGGGRALEFSSRYGNRAFQTQRSGPMPGSIPTLAECDEMMNHQKRVLDSMQSIKEIIIAQQHALAEQRNYEINHKPSSDADEDGASFSDKLEGSGGFAGADTKKRRGRAAPPGRCHSCNRAETPEWRRGPDGARTLCNACGLHYAKLTRKMGPKASSTGSNLRPKEASQGSP